MDPTVINFKLKAHNEIEEAQPNESDEEDFDSENADEDNDESMETRVSLVPKSDGVMTIKQHPNTGAIHVCTKCSKSYKTAMGLKRHTNLCRHLPSIENVTKIPNLVHDVHSVGDEAAKEAKCFCCFEEIAIAHVIFVYLKLTFI